MNSRKILRAAGLTLAGALGLWLFAAVLLPVLLPFLIGLAVAALVEKPVAALLRRTRIPRGLASFVCVLAVYAALGTGLFFLCRTLLGELMGFLRRLPELAQALAGPLLRLETRLLELAARLPDGIGSGLRSGIRSLFESGSLLGAKVYEWLFSFASGLLGKAPGMFLFIVTSVLASFMSSSELPALRELASRKLPERWRARLSGVLGHLKTSLGGWLRAQLKLMGITFLILNAGLLLLRVRYPVLAALIITVVDALPVFGTGTILIPWALALFLQGETKTGIGLVILYGAAALSRQALEPRLVGKQVGLNPVLTLLALYTGYRLLGVGGMIVFPIAAMLFKQLWDHSGLQPDG